MAAVGADRDNHTARVGPGQILVLGGEERGQGQVRVAAADVLRIQPDVSPQFGRAVVQPADLPAGPGCSDQLEHGCTVA